MFAIRNETNDSPHIFGKSDICCNTILNNVHISMCQKLNEGVPVKLKYKNILHGTPKENIAVLKHFQNKNPS